MNADFQEKSEKIRVFIGRFFVYPGFRFICFSAALPQTIQYLWLSAVIKLVKYLALCGKARLYSDHLDAEIVCASLFGVLPQSQVSPKVLPLRAV